MYTLVCVSTDAVKGDNGGDVDGWRACVKGVGYAFLCMVMLMLLLAAASVHS